MYTTVATTSVFQAIAWIAASSSTAFAINHLYPMKMESSSKKVPRKLASNGSIILIAKNVYLYCSFAVGVTVALLDSDEDADDDDADEAPEEEEDKDDPSDAGGYFDELPNI